MISNEVQNTSRIFLYKEGSVYCSYERSAWFLCTFVDKPFEVIGVPSPKDESETILAIRIFVEEMAAVLSKFPCIVNAQDRIIIQAPSSFNVYNFYRWKAQIREQNNKSRLQKKQQRQSGINEILSLIESFDTITSSHLDCMNFIERLKSIKAGL